GAVLVEIAVIAKSAEEELQRLALDQPFAGDVIDHEMREVGLAGDRAQGREFRGREAHQVNGVGMRVGDRLELGRVGRLGQPARLAELGQLGLLWCVLVHDAASARSPLSLSAATLSAKLWLSPRSMDCRKPAISS